MTKQKSSATKSAPHIRALHKRRAMWFVVLIAGVLLIQAAYNMHHGQAQVLGYTTAITTQSLLEATNEERMSQGSGPLTDDQSLQRIAQAKAEDMAKRNYWSHVTPDGKEPWAVLTANNYNYSKAGENLAYGFNTSDEVISAWLRSDTHKANVLGEFEKVGFGIVNAHNYQESDSTDTIVVALYATPQTDKAAKAAVAGQTVASNNRGGISGFAMVVAGGANWATYASLSLVGAAAIGFLVTHLELLRHGWYRSKYYLALHPIADAAVVVAIALVLVYAAGGFIL